MVFEAAFREEPVRLRPGRVPFLVASTGAGRFVSQLDATSAAQVVAAEGRWWFAETPAGKGSMKKKEEKLVSLRIVTQYRARRGMVYELEIEGAMLDVHVSPRATPVDADEWAVEARSSRGSDAVAVVGWGPTRSDALAAAGRDWQLNAALHPFDWNAVRTLLSGVGAL